MSNENTLQAKKIVDVFMHKLLPSLLQSSVYTLFQDHVKDSLIKEVSTLLEDKNKATFNERDCVYKMASVLNFKELLTFNEQRNLSRNMFDLDKHIKKENLSEEELMDITLVTKAFYFSSINNMDNIISKGMNSVKLKKNDFSLLTNKNLREPIRDSFENVKYIKGEEKNRLYKVISLERAQGLILLSFIDKPLVNPNNSIVRKLCDSIFAYGVPHFIQETSFVYHKNILMSGVNKEKAKSLLEKEISLMVEENNEKKSDRLKDFMGGFMDQRSFAIKNDIVISNEFLDFLGVNGKKSHFDWALKGGTNYWHSSVVANAITKDGLLKNLKLTPNNLKLLDEVSSDIVSIRSRTAPNSSDVAYDFIKGTSETYNVQQDNLHETLQTFFENVFVTKEDRSLFKELVLKQTFKNANEILKKLVDGKKNMIFLVDLYDEIKDSGKLDTDKVKLNDVHNSLSYNFTQIKTASSENEMAYFLDKFNGLTSPEKEFYTLLSALKYSANIEESPILTYMEDKYGANASKFLLDVKQKYDKHKANELDDKDKNYQFEIDGNVVYTKELSSVLTNLSEKSIAFLNKLQIKEILGENSVPHNELISGSQFKI